MRSNNLNNRFFFGAFLALFFLIGYFGDVRADDEDKLGYMRFAYWAYGSGGDLTVRGDSANVTDKEFFNGSLNGFSFEGERSFDEDWGLNLDFFFGTRSGTKQVSSSESVDWRTQFTFITAGAFYSVVQAESETGKTLTLDGMAGLRSIISDVKLEFNPFDPVTEKGGSKELNWVDPYVGLRLKSALGPKWAVELYGDAGGFGIGSASELSVMGRALVVWSASPTLQLLAGYRLFNLKSNNQSGTNQSELNLRMSGPMLGLGLQF